MTKINRRDYLKGIGATAAMLSARPLDLLAQSWQPLARGGEGPVASIMNPRQAVPPEAPAIWENRWPNPFPTYASNQVIQLIFYGQNGFANRIPSNPTGSVTCDVGFHDRGDSTHHHRLSIAAYSDGCNEVFTTDPPAGRHLMVREIGLTVNANDIVPEFKNGVYFFQPTDPSPVLSRSDLVNDADFRWIVDFESDYLYRKFLTSNVRSLPKHKNIYRPAFNIPYGLFYTLHKTACTFKAETKKPKNVSHLMNVADYIGANIYVQPNSAVALAINGKCYLVKAPGAIYFFNFCFEGGDFMELCKPDPDDIDHKEKRGDFFLHYKAFDRGNAPEYELFLDQRNPPRTDDLRDFPCVDIVTKNFSRFMHPMHDAANLVRVISDEAPCAGAGYGGGGGIPPYPPS